MIQTEEKRSYYAVIPSKVRYDSQLSPHAKLLYGEITALCNQSGICWASNSYFSELYGVSTRTISRWISSLVYGGYIEIRLQYKQGTKEVESRHIQLAEGIDKNVNTYGQNCHEPIDKNVNTPIDKNVAENNTSSFNNTSNKKKERKKNGYDELLSSVEDESLRDLYYEYIKMRKLIKAPMTDRALQMLIHKVEELESDVERQKKLLQTAIMNNWKSVYPLKGDEKNAELERHAPIKAEGIIRL